MSKRIMTKNTDKQAIDNLADNFNGYAALLRKIKQRVLVAQQRAIYAANEEMLRMYWDIGGMLRQSQDADGWGKKTLQRLSVDLKNDYSEIKGFTVRNMQYMVQFFNEYNQELTMIKRAASPNAKSVISHLDEYNFTLPIKHLDWTHNLVLIKQVKDIRARYWYMVHRLHDVLAIDWSMQKQLHDVLALTGQCKSNDRTFGLKRPHVWASTTARFRRNGRMMNPDKTKELISLVKPAL